MTDSSIPPEPDFESFLLGDYTGPPEENSEFGTVEYTTPPADDNIETGFEESTIQVGDGSCIVCGAPTFRPPGLTKTGRKKRAPKYCDLHTRDTKISSKGPVTSGLADKSIQRIQEELADDVRLLGTMAGPLLPVTGYYIFERADAFTIAILKLAKNNQNVLRVLHRAAQIAPVYTVAETVAGAAYSVQVDTQGADAHNTIGTRLGVARAYDSVYPEQQTNVSTNGFQGPPKYASTASTT